MMIIELQNPRENRMARSEQEEAELAKIRAYATAHGFYLNPDEGVVERVVRGLLARKSKTGHAYCPCRMVSGDPARDQDIVCPCTHHADEIRQQGHCHCLLLVSKEYLEKHRGGTPA